MATPLTAPDEESDVYQRAPESLSSRLPSTITSTERIMVLYKMLCRMKYGDRRDQYGITKLLKEKVFVDAYPLHEGPYEWTEFGELTDRQLLAEFWGNIRCWYKEQPINLIEKYFGTEFGFYFAWLGYYVKMLLPMAALSFLCVLYGVLTIPTSQNTRSHEICNSNLVMCPRCHYSQCKYESLKSSCVQSNVTYMFDNPATITLAIIVSVWSTVFMEFWQREQSVLQLRWNVKSLEHDTVKRPEYIEHATGRKFSPITETNEPHINDRIIVAGYTITVLSLLLMIICSSSNNHEKVNYRIDGCSRYYELGDHYDKMRKTYNVFVPLLFVTLMFGNVHIGRNCSNISVTNRSGTKILYTLYFSTNYFDFQLILVILAVLGVMVYRTSVDLILIRDSKEVIIIDNTRVIASVTGACMNATFIFIFRAIFKVVALKLTDLENHRTQNEYDNSYIYKRYSLEFINNYAAVFYIAFFKGRFFTHPGDMGKWTDLGGLGSDICAPTGCILDLGISLMIIMLTKIAVSNFAQIFLPVIITKFKKIMAKIKNTEYLPLYEKEYFLPATGEYFLVDEYLDMVIQYGFVVFFAAGFPLAPALAFFNNLLEVRVDASKLTKSYRRPIPRKTSNIGAWFGILQATTYIGVAINALVIAFTSSFIQNEIYTHSTDLVLEGFLNRTISAYATEDFEILARSMKTPKVCFYLGRRYPPDHERKYELTKDHWFLLAMRFLIVLCFEHVIIMIKGILAYAIPDVPGYVTLQLALQERRNRDLRMKALHDKYMENRKEMGFKTVFTPIELP